MYSCTNIPTDTPRLSGGWELATLLSATLVGGGGGAWWLWEEDPPVEDLLTKEELKNRRLTRARVPLCN